MPRTQHSITNVMLAANNDANCAGLVLWMHTFSPSKMWIRGLNVLKKPFLHLHTQFNRDLPWGTIDMDFMNLNQAAHGDREAVGFAEGSVASSARHRLVAAATLDGERGQRRALHVRCTPERPAHRRLRLPLRDTNVTEQGSCVNT